MPRPRARLLRPVALPLVVCATLGGVFGCGAEPTAVRAADGQVAIALDDFLLDPQIVRAPAREPLRISLRNRGRLGHTFRLRRDGRLYAKVQTLRPGERTELTRTLAPGAYRMFCAIANHDELGLSGTLVVR